MKANIFNDCEAFGRCRSVITGDGSGFSAFFNTSHSKFTSNHLWSKFRHLCASFVFNIF